MKHNFYISNNKNCNGVNKVRSEKMQPFNRFKNESIFKKAGNKKGKAKNERA